MSKMQHSRQSLRVLLVGNEGEMSSSFASGLHDRGHTVCFVDQLVRVPAVYGFDVVLN